MSLIRFTPIAEITEPLNITLGLSGGSSTGKTYTACRVATGMAEEWTGRKMAPFGMVDTENRRGLHYKGAFPNMMHFDMKAVNAEGAMVGFGPERWIEVIDAAEAAGLPALVIDSFSHAWEGVGGVLDMQATRLATLVEESERRAAGKYTVDPSKLSEQAWIEPKQRYRRLIDRIVRAQLNIIICTRAKPVRQVGYGEKAKNARDTKTRRSDVPWDPAADRDLMFEMTAMMILDPSRPGAPVYQIKCADQFKTLFDPFRPMDEDTGRQMVRWGKSQANSQAEKAAMDAARDAARKGKDALTAYWNSEEGKAHRPALRAIMADLQTIAGEAEARLAQADSDPFAGQSSEPTAEQMAAAMAEAEAAAKAAEAEGMAA